MRSFIAFFKKELLESVRSGRLMILVAIFVIVGIMNPAIAKLTPWLYELMAEELAESGMIITEVAVDALASWTQFFKNIPMALIAFVLICAGGFSKEYESDTLVIVLTKGLSRYKVVLAKAASMLLLWTAGYWLCFGITYGYNAYFWDNSIATGLAPAAFNWWLFGIFTVSLTVLFSVMSKNYSTVLLGTGGFVFVSYLLGLLPKIARYLPTTLMNSGAVMVGAESFSDSIWAVVIASAASIVFIAVSIPIFNKKQI